MTSNNGLLFLLMSMSFQVKPKANSEFPTSNISVIKKKVELFCPARTRRLLPQDPVTLPSLTERKAYLFWTLNSSDARSQSAQVHISNNLLCSLQQFPQYPHAPTLYYLYALPITKPQCTGVNGLGDKVGLSIWRNPDNRKASQGVAQVNTSVSRSQTSVSHLTHADPTVLGPKPSNPTEECLLLHINKAVWGQFLSQLKECKCDRSSFQVSPSPLPHCHSPTKLSWIVRSLLGLLLGGVTAGVI